MSVTHKVWKLGADIDTDQLAPGAYMKLGIEGIAPHCLEAVRPEFAAQVRPGDVIAAGPNFGIGSSRAACWSCMLAGATISRRPAATRWPRSTSAAARRSSSLAPVQAPM